jgi:hypothetical protein
MRPASAAELPMMAAIAEVLALSGDGEQARRMVQGFSLLSLDTAISRFRQALLSLALGEKQNALSLLELAVEDREAELVWLGVDPRLDSLRQTTSFVEICGKVNPHWQFPSFVAP